MGDYLKRLCSSSAMQHIKALVPSNLCPFLFYNLSPYIYTLTRGGWFAWVIRSKDASYRKPIDRTDFERRQVNQIYPNEVLVRCPNPYENVVAGLGFGLSGNLSVRILNATGHCPACHEPGDTLVIDTRRSAADAAEYNRIFPGELYRHRSETALDRAGDCRLVMKTVAVEVAKMYFPCRYHRKQQAFGGGLLPDGFCPHVFARLYPDVLALMYNASVAPSFEVEHPGCHGPVHLKIEKKNLHCTPMSNVVQKIKHALAKVYALILHPVDFTDYEIEITVLDTRGDFCSLKNGKSYRVNMHSQAFLCPAAFHALYPFILLAFNGSSFDWNSNGHDKERLLAPCPDCVGSIYALANMREAI